MSQIEAEPAAIRLVTLNTGLSGEQVFPGADSNLSPEWRLEHILAYIHRLAKQRKPLAVTLQEVYADHLERYGNALGGNGNMAFSRYCELSMTDSTDNLRTFGVAIGSNLRLSNVQKRYYDRHEIDPRKIILNNGADHAHSLLQAEVSTGGSRFRLGTTHFSWHSSGVPSPHQLEDFTKLKELLDGEPELILTGDFNTARGNKIFDTLAEMYKDNIPPEVETTFDGTIRPAVADVEVVIDGLFTSPEYQVRRFKMMTGFSDHRLIQALVRRIAQH